jgi:hypothetical protein
MSDSQSESDVKIIILAIILNLRETGKIMTNTGTGGIIKNPKRMMFLQVTVMTGTMFRQVTLTNRIMFLVAIPTRTETRIKI